jgi:hypothetical protein
MRITQCDNVGVDHLGNHVVKLGFRPPLEAFPDLVSIGNSRTGFGYSHEPRAGNHVITPIAIHLPVCHFD